MILGIPTEALIIWLLIGAVSGWLAGMIVEGGGFGLIGDIVVGILGSFIAGWLLPKVGVHIGSGLLAHIINGAIGGVVFLLIVALIRRK
jgi:uncharacterized membrane protein YeaQ/YmgE (transglycosylase-associated protein family)